MMSASPPVNTATPTHAALAPIAPRARVQGIDIARGIALLGIILVNARFFFLPFMWAAEPNGVPADHPNPVNTLDLLVRDAVNALCTFKFISTFSILFGFGLSQQIARARAAGQSRWPFMLRRLGLMLAIGLVHGLFVWYGDILAIYAVIGTVVVAAASLSDRWLRRIVITLAVLTLTLTTLVGALRLAFGTSAQRVDAEVRAVEPSDAAEHQEATEAPPPRGFDAMMKANFDPNSRIWISAEIAAFQQGPWLDAMAFRSASYAFAVVAAIFSYGWHVLLMMLIGVLLQRSSFFSPDAAHARWRFIRVGLSIGLPCAIASVLPHWIWGRSDGMATFLEGSLLVVSALTLPLAYAPLIVEVGPRLPAFIREPLAATGRMALTIYLCESILCTALASWWGFGLFGTMNDAQFTLLAATVWVVLVGVAFAWRRLLGDGPVERLWRAASYGSRPKACGGRASC